MSSGRRLNPTAKKLLIYGVGGMLLGTLTTAYGVSFFSWLSSVAGYNAEPGLQLVSLIITLLRGLLIPIGAAFIGAAIVIDVTFRESADDLGSSSHRSD